MEDSTNRTWRRGAGLAIGIGLGTALGVAMGKLAIGLAIGIAIGLAFDGLNRRRSTGCQDRS